MLIEDKIAQIASYVFTIALLVFFVYLFFTHLWFVYFLASLNLISIFALTFILIKKFFDKKPHN